MRCQVRSYRHNEKRIDNVIASLFFSANENYTNLKTLTTAADQSHRDELFFNYSSTIRVMRVEYVRYKDVKKNRHFIASRLHRMLGNYRFLDMNIKAHSESIFAHVHPFFAFVW